jgi:LAO/AO transport system kinase
MPDVFQQIHSFMDHVKGNSYFTRRRQEQSAWWMHETIREKLTSEFYGDERVKAQLKDIEQKVNKGKISSFAAAERLIKLYKEE